MTPMADESIAIRLDPETEVERQVLREVNAQRATSTKQVGGVKMRYVTLDEQRRVVRSGQGRLIAMAQIAVEFKRGE